MRHLKKLTPLGIAIWYMDDGSTLFQKNSVGKIESRKGYLNTQGYTKEENETLNQAYSNLENIEALLYNLNINKNETKQEEKSSGQNEVNVVTTKAKNKTTERNEEVEALKKEKEDKYANAVESYEGGKSIQQIADEYKITRQAMWDILKRRNCKFRPNQRYGNENHFYRGGKTANDHSQNLLEQAIEDGKIERKYACEKCGANVVFADGRTGIQAHHCDYNKPLEVMWLCQKCHHEWHKNNKAVTFKGGDAHEKAEKDNTRGTIDIIFGGFP